MSEASTEDPARQHMAPERSSQRRKPVWSGWATGACVAAFVGGLVAASLAGNVLADEQLKLSSLQLLGFALTVLVSGASIVLAVAAIALGRASEDALIQRSDESLRLQNEVFTRTMNALQRIESSTGVTEKRLEDIIGGRVGDLSERLAEITASGQGGKINMDDLQQQIKDSILQELQPSSDRSQDADHEKRRKAREARNKSYRTFHSSVLNAFEALPDHKEIKRGDGSMNAEGLDLFDGVYQRGTGLVGVSTFDEGMASGPMLTNFLFNVGSAVLNDQVQHVYVAVRTSSPERADNIQQALDKSLSVLAGNPREHVTLIAGTNEEVLEVIPQLGTDSYELTSEPSGGTHPDPQVARGSES